MGYINFKEEVCVANIQLEKRRKNNINANELLLKNKNTLPNYKPCEKYSFKVNEDLFVGKEGLLREEEFYELKNKDILSAKFINCKFYNVKFKDCNIIGCCFERCDFGGGGVIFENCTFVKEESDMLPALNKKDNLSCSFYHCSLYCKFKMGKASYLIFEKCLLENTNFENIDLSNIISKECDFNKIEMKDVNLSGAKFVNCYMEDFTFNDLDKSKLDTKTFFDKVKCKRKTRDEYEGLYKYYEDLADKFLENNLRNNYGEYYYLCNKEKRKTLDFIPKIASDLYLVTCGYGERPWYSVISSLIIIAIFAFLFLCVGLEVQGEELKYSMEYFRSKSILDMIKDYNKMLLLSSSTFGGVGMEHTIQNQLGYIIENLEIVFGVGMMAIGAGTLTRKIIR